MNRSANRWLIIIVVLVVFSLLVDLKNNITITSPVNQKDLINRDTQFRLGLDLRGGLQTLLEADVANCDSVEAEALDLTRQILESRANGLGVSEITMQTAGNCRIVAEFPGISNPEEVVASLQQTALLEFVDMGTNPLPVGTIIQTDHDQGASSQPTVTPQPSASATPSTEPTQVYHTVMTGAGLDTVSVARNEVGQYLISFTLKPDATQVFGDYTGTHVQQYLAIILDKQVISTPVIQQPITDGQGQISGSFTAESANNLAIQLRYGSLPVPVKVVESRTVGPTLGAESVRKSLLAGKQAATLPTELYVYAFDAHGAHAMRAQRVHDLVGGGLHVPVRGTGGDHHVVGEVADSPHVEHRDIARFGIFQGGLDPTLYFVRSIGFRHQ